MNPHESYIELSKKKNCLQLHTIFTLYTNIIWLTINYINFEFKCEKMAINANYIIIAVGR